MNKKQHKTKKPHAHHVPIGVTVLIGIVFVATLSLLFVWNQVPRPTPPAPSYVEKIPEVKTPPITQPVGATHASPLQNEPAGFPPGPVRERPAGMICDSLNEYCVDEDVSGSLLANPFTVAVDTALDPSPLWWVADANGIQILQGQVSGTSSQRIIRDFFLSAPTTATGTLSVGNEMYYVTIPVRLPTQSQKTKLFLLTDPAKDCSAVTPIEITIGKTAFPVEATLRSLLLEREPTTPRTYSAISQGVELQSLTVKNGTAFAVFSPSLEPGGGSCAVTGIRASIEATLKQFPSIKNVEISVIGKTAAETLQP